MKIDQFLRDKGVEFSVISHPETYDAQRLAQALHVSGREVAKTVLLSADSDFAHIVAVLPATKSVDLDRISDALGGSKVALATEIEIKQHCPDCEMGVLPPFGSQYGMKTLVETSLAEDEEIFFEGNTHHEAIRMKFADFRRIEEPLVVSFAQQS
jgi:Ala-tRNA(Pro) deacylase